MRSVNRTRIPLFCFQLLLICLTILTYNSIIAQNLVPNPNFENFTACPNNASQIERAVPWNDANEGTSDYYNACATIPTFDVPAQLGNYQPALTGNAYAGCYFRFLNGNYREYIQAPLVQPLETGKCYKVGFFLNLINSFCGSNQAGIYISDNAPFIADDIVLPVTPQISSSSVFFSDTVNWIEVKGLYTAVGGEKFITIGNFKSDAETLVDPGCPNSTLQSYYYIDSVYVMALGTAEELPIDLGPDVEVCTEQELNGNSGNVNYHWSTGETTQNIIVTTSGTYALTITQECAIGIDSVEVIINGNSIVDINPAQVTICEGDSFEIHLDPALGDYTWSDGSTATDYFITTPGTYSVTLDNGCSLSTDAITIEQTLIPQPFSIGTDTILCANDDFEIVLATEGNNIIWSDGSTSASYTISTPGLHSVTISNECGSASDMIEVTGMAEPQIELGTDTIVWCEGDILEYEFDPSLGNFIWNDGSSDPCIAITASGIYSVTVTNQCGTSQDMITVFEASEPVIGFDDTIRICNHQIPYTLQPGTLTPVDNLIWSTGSTSSSITVSTEGVYAVTVSNNCFNKIDSVYLEILNIPSPGLPDSTLLCQGDTVILNATVASATYLWQDGSVEPIYEVSSPGTYSVTVANTCGEVTDSVHITAFSSVGQPDLGPDIAICVGDQLILYANAIGDTYTWNDNSNGDSLLINTAGTYSITVEDACGILADTIVVHSSDIPPEINLPDTAKLCDDQQIILEAGLSGSNYLWSNGSSDPSITVSLVGTYSVTVSNNCGTSMDSTVVESGGQLPVIDLGNDTIICTGETLQLTPSYSMADVLTWNNGSTSPELLIISPGQYSITAQNNCGIAHDTIDIIELPDLVSFSLGNDTLICAGEQLLLEVNINNTTITWSDGSGGNSFIVNQAGTYYAIANDLCSSVSDTIEINFLYAPPNLDLGSDQLICPGETIMIDPMIAGVDYLWNDGSTNTNYTTTQAGVVSLSISNQCGIQTDTIVITESTLGPQLDLGPDLIACEGDTLTLHAGIAGVQYEWSDGTSQSFTEITFNSEISLHVSNACGEADDTVLVVFHPLPMPSLGPDTVICNATEYTLTGPDDPGSVLTWHDGSHANQLMVNTSGTYSLTQENNCGVAFDEITITFERKPDFSLGPDTVICKNESLQLSAPGVSGQFIWQDASTDPTLNVNNGATYALTVTNECGTASDEIVVGIDTLIPEFNFDTYEICPGQSIQLNVSQNFTAQYLWSTGVTSPDINIFIPGLYSVTVSTPCFSNTANVEIHAGNDCKPVTSFYIPNVFSPNGDNINDEFSIYFNLTADIISIDGGIYDRWGNLIFSSSSNPFVWDGNFKGKNVQSGVYVYRFTIVYGNGLKVLTEQLTGDVTLIR